MRHHPRYTYFAPPPQKDSTLDRKLQLHQASWNKRPHTAGLKGSAGHDARKQRATKTLSKLRMPAWSLRHAAAVNSKAETSHAAAAAEAAAAAAMAETAQLLRRKKRYRVRGGGGNTG